MQEYSFGTVRLEVEVVEDERDRIETLQELEQRYQHLRKKQKEHLYALYLNNDNRVIGDKLISLGQSVQTSLDVKDVTQTAVLTDASAVILVHNHPSGNCEPTESDLEATEQLQGCLERFGVSLLDHVIISRNGSYSMKRRGTVR
jgi:DNA repair protein RadC